MDAHARRPLPEAAALDLLREAAAALDARVIEIEGRLAGPDGATWLTEVSVGGGKEAAGALLAEALAEARRAVSSPAAAGAVDATLVEVWGLLAASGHEPFAALGASAVAARGAAHAAPLSAPEHPGSIGRYELLEPLGAGASGVVFRARHRDHGGSAAVKLLRLEAQSPRQAERFRREARILSRLAHPAIVRVLDSGVALRDGLPTPYLVSELIEGRPFDVALRAAPRDVVLRSFAEVCEGVAHAHEHGVLHRDLKAANVLVDTAFHAHVLDFGLAREDPAEVDGTRTGEVLGTLVAMSPEQARGERSDERSDVWALGALLFATICGEAPHDFRGQGPSECLRRIGASPARRLRALRPEAERDLAAVVDRALALERDARYRSATELLFDVRRLLAGDPVEARPPGFLEALLRFARRHRVASGMALGLLLLVLGATTAIALALQASQRDQRELLATIERLVQYAERMVETSTTGAPEVRILEETIERLNRTGAGIADDVRWSTESRLREVLGDISWRLSSVEAARGQRDRVLELERRRSAGGLANERALARALVKRGDLESPRDPRAALRFHLEAHAILERAARAEGAALGVRDDHGWSLERLAAQAAARQEGLRASRLSAERLAVARELLALRDDGLRRYALVSASLLHADHLGRFGASGETTGAEIRALLEDACAHALRAVALDPERRSFLRAAVIAHERRGRALLQSGEAASARALLHEPRRWISGWLVRDPLCREYRECAILVESLLGECALALAEEAEALRCWELAWEHAQALISATGAAPLARDFGTTLARRVREVLSGRGGAGDLTLWERRWSAALERAASMPDATAYELAQLARWLGVEAPAASREPARARELARRALASVRPDHRPDLHDEITEAAELVGLEVEARELERRLRSALDAAEREH